VAITNPSTCSSGVGYPGESGTIDLNLGWCNQANHLGSVIHELGHALGMNHEQNRADAAEQARVTGGWQGPYLNVKWQNIDQAWRPQWQGQKRSYTGSQTAGYSAYDYESIMHYGLSDQATAVNSAFQNVPGQRSSLSSGDIAQFKDMYQCNAGSAPSPAPGPSPTPQPTPGPAPAGCEDGYMPWGNTCAGWKASGACETSTGIREHCKVTCGTFGCGTPSSTPSPTPSPTRSTSAGSGSSGGSSGCRDESQPGGYSCAQWKNWGYCGHSNSIPEHYCRVTCGTCHSSSSGGSSGGSSSRCSDTQGALSYGQTCALWAEQGHCKTSQWIQRDCPGSCGEVDKQVHGYSCSLWRKAGSCPVSETLKRECPHLCDQCR
jgi:hypothetical protein